MGTNRFPTGVTYSGDHLAKLVRAARQNQAIIIENDMAGELGHGELNRMSLKAYDDDDTVLQFGGTVSYLSSSYEIGWVLAGRRAATLIANRHLGGTHLPHIALQATLADYLKSRQIDRDLRHACHTLAQRMSQGIDLPTTMSCGRLAVSAPAGGYLCWVRGSRNFDSMKLAMTAGIDILDFIPGPFFSPAGAFSNFLALNFSAEWTCVRKTQLRRLIGAMLL
ncbi:hypothetical protein OO306_03970 [Pseudomonas sp. DCB_AW]|uniref:hypothetical protein n=1 Tax=Pseudomonas sp. DCB_AW TaxID=2993596 RepID=UPI002248F6D5|nr:hypothetical protein [Pseudomonas sp. DCB_AW]MCX2684706.1 hypothetical protein [Pseudomonas sp. DCB_AW]